MATQIRQIKVVVDTKGSRELQETARQLGLMNKNVKSLSDSMRLLTGAFISYFSAISIRDLAAVSDRMQQLHSRISILTGGTEEATKIFNQLGAVANRTKTSVDSLAEIYARLAQTTKATKLTQEEMLDVTEILQNSFRLSGATTEEATNTIIQLSQAFSSGQLRGQELRSVLEQNAVLAEKLRNTYGRDIFKKAETGAISAAGVLKILFENQEEINKSAAKMSQTFGQTLIVAMNDVKKKIFEINKDFDVSGKFAKGVEFITENFRSLVAIILILATSAIPKLVRSITTLATATLAIGAKNPMLLLFQALAIASVILVENIDKVRVAFLKLKILFEEAMQWRDKIDKSFLSANFFWIDFDKNINKSAEAVKKYRSQIEAIEKQQGGPTDLAKQEEEAAKRREATIKKLLALEKQVGGKEKKIKELLADINQEYIRGAINAEQYARKLDEFELTKLNREFRDGKINLNKFNIELNGFRLRDLNRDFTEGAIGLDEFDRKIRDNKIEELNIKIKAGVINLKEYNAELIKINENFDLSGSATSGAYAYIESIGTVSSQVASAITSTFNRLEDNLLEFIKTGKFNFAQFTQAILDDLTRIIIRAAIIRPLAQGIIGAFSSEAPVGTGTAYQGRIGSSPTQFAKGGVFSGGVNKFASGGLVNSPTLFSYGNNRRGLMGEAGPEAILPLSRTSSGKLGVQASTSPVVVNIINNSGNEVTQTETTGPNGEKMIEVLIHQKVRDGVLQGQYDKVLQSSYGLQRKGS